MLQANLYIDRIDLARYLTPAGGEPQWRPKRRRAGARLQNGTLKLTDCPFFHPLFPSSRLGM